MAENKIINGCVCDPAMQGRHEAELKALKEGQDRMEGSIKDLTVAIKEYVTLTQNIQSKRIDDMEKRVDNQEERVDIVEKDYGRLKDRSDLHHKVIVGGAAALIVGMVGVIFGFLWSNAIQHAQPEKVKSCLTYFVC